MTRPEQQADELVLLNRLVAWDPALAGAEVSQPDPPEPDGVFVLPDSSQIAIELTESVRDESLTGGVTRGHESNQEKAIAAASGALGPRPELDIRVQWSTAPPAKWPAADVVGPLLAAAVAAHTPQAPGPTDVITTEDIEWEALDPGLQTVISSITIWRTREPMAGGWTSLVAGTRYTDPGNVQGLLDNKAAKLAAYAKPGRPNWLLIHAAAITITGMADFESLLLTTVVTPFDRVLVYDPFLQFQELKIS